jgi:hypothetical protein
MNIEKELELLDKCVDALDLFIFEPANTDKAFETYSENIGATIKGDLTLKKWEVACAEYFGRVA